MGTDIHETWEHKGDDGIWTEIEGVPGIRRNYYLFGVLAGVRGQCAVPMQRDRGIPADSTVCATDPEYHHNPGWVSLSEILEQRAWHLDGPDYRDDPVCGLSEQIKHLAGFDPDRVRLVFYFDS